MYSSPLLPKFHVLRIKIFSIFSSSLSFLSALIYCKNCANFLLDTKKSPKIKAFFIKKILFCSVQTSPHPYNCRLSTQNLQNLHFQIEMKFPSVPDYPHKPLLNPPEIFGIALRTSVLIATAPVPRLLLERV